MMEREVAITHVISRLQVATGTEQMTTKLLLEFPTESYQKNVLLFCIVKLKVLHKVNKVDLSVSL